jgi:hypothetical protein
VMIRRSASCTRATLLPPRSATDSVARCRRRQKKPTEDELRPRKKVSKTTQASDSVGNWDKLPLCVLLGAAASRLFPGYLGALLLRKHAASRRAGAESNPNCGEALFLTRTLLCCSAVSLATC